MTQGAAVTSGKTTSRQNDTILLKQAQMMLFLMEVLRSGVVDNTERV